MLWESGSKNILKALCAKIDMGKKYKPNEPLKFYMNETVRWTILVRPDALNVQKEELWIELRLKRDLWESRI